MTSANANEVNERGFFWWSDEPISEGHLVPDIGSFGLLTITSVGQVKLSLDGMLTRSGHPLEALRNSGRRLSTQILGVLKNDNRSVMLIKVWGDGGRANFGGLSNENFTAEVCLLSLQRAEWPVYPLVCDEIIISLAGFEEWLRLGSASIQKDGTSFVVQYNKPESRRYYLGDGVISIDYDYMARARFLSKTDELTFKEEALLTYKSSRPILVDEIVDIYTSLEDLLILLTNVERSLIWPLVRFDSSNCATLYHRRRSRMEDAVEHQNCWTSFPGLEPNLERIFQLWRSKRNLISPGIYFYLGTRRGAQLNTELQFISFVCGLEAFHRALNPSSHGRSRGAGGNLEQRIKALFSPLPTGFEKRKLHAFANKCQSIRNDITHYGQILREGNYLQQMKELALVNLALDNLYHARILLEVGVSSETIKWIFNGSPRSFYIRYVFWRVGLGENEHGFTQAKDEEET